MLLWQLLSQDSVSERLRRWTRNPLGSARRGANPLAVVFIRLSSTTELVDHVLARRFVRLCTISKRDNGIWEALYISVTPAAAVT